MHVLSFFSILPNTLLLFHVLISLKVSSLLLLGALDVFLPSCVCSPTTSILPPPCPKVATVYSYSLWHLPLLSDTSNLILKLGHHSYLSSKSDEAETSPDKAEYWNEFQSFLLPQGRGWELGGFPLTIIYNTKRGHGARVNKNNIKFLTILSMNFYCLDICWLLEIFDCF